MHKKCKKNHEYPATLKRCPECHKINSANWYKNNKLKAAASNAAWTKANPDKVKTINNRWKKANPGEVKGIKLRKLYWPNLTWEDALKEYSLIFVAQNGLCASCKQPETFVSNKSGKVQDLSVDHCHKTGKIRGLLCNNCNRAEGMLTSQTARMLAEYMERHEI